MLQRGKHAVETTAALLSGKDMAAGKAKFGHLNMCLRRVLQGGRGDEVTFQQGRGRAGIKLASQKHAAASTCAGVSSAPLDHELVPFCGDFMHNTHLNVGGVCPQLAPLLLPGDVQAEAVDAVRDVPIEDILQHTQWERAKQSMQHQEELQQAVAAALPALLAPPRLASSPPPLPPACAQELVTLWPAPAGSQEETPVHEDPVVPAPGTPQPALGAAGDEEDCPPPASPPGAPLASPPVPHRVQLREKVNIGLVGSQLKLASAVVSIEGTHIAQDAFVQVNAPGLTPPEATVQQGHIASLKGSLPAAAKPMVALTSKVKWSGCDGLLVVRGRLGLPAPSAQAAIPGTCDMVIQLGSWLQDATLVSVRASSSVKLASNRQDVLWHLPAGEFLLGQEVTLKAKCTVSRQLPSQLQGQVLNTPWKARVRSSEYTLGTAGRTSAAAARVEAGSGQVDCTVSTELVVVAKPATN